MLLLVFLLATLAAAEDWPKYRHDINNTGASGESTITTSNVGSLKLKWEFQVGASITTEPAVATVNGTSIVFFGDWNGTFYALNAVTGQKIWSFQIDAISGCKQSAMYACKTIGSSASVVNGIVYFGAHNAFVYALDATNGAVVWKNQVADPNQNYAVWTSPAVYNGLVYVGLANAGNDAPCVVGQVIALNASTGASVWSFQTIDETSCSSGICTGAGVWASPALNAANNILYVGTGNPGASCMPSTANATRYPDSMLALNMSSGTLLNYYQAITNDKGDRDFGSSPVLWQSKYDNYCTGTHSTRSWVAEANKNSDIYVLQTTSSGIDSNNYSQAFGSDGFVGSMAVTPVVTKSKCNTAGQQIVQVRGVLYAGSGQGSVGGHMYNPTQQSWSLPKIADTWAVSVSYPTPIFGAVTRVTGVIFVGSHDHTFYAYNARNGAQLWSYTTAAPVDGSAAISNGRVYFGATDGYLRCFSVNGQ
ncbi:MAG: PQQ-binding-like beta-propeller repeat protein [Acidobacteria bacterium]|nr:PQQ-binding-like beta-propeller repeat protein [Acidobacteriota bacterium]MBV9625525.1 PQQ-binding-like beta-propeller repeat protein [Acidobacteriota bacterium]